MKNLWAVLMVCALAVVSIDADAKRMGGGKSFGQQSSNVTQRQATPPAAPGAPTQNATNAAPAKPAPAAPAAAPKKPWGAMLGGLAAGLGLAWLANSLGLGAAFGNFLLIALLVLEFSKVAQPLAKAYDWYSFQVLPRLGRWVAGDADSYRYLAESIRVHPSQAELKAIMKDAGFGHVDVHNLSAGVVALHVGLRC